MHSAKRPTVRLGRTRRLALYTISIGVWLSGGAWLLFHYFFVQQGEFGPQTNPLEPWCLKLHGAFAFAALWFFGLLWGIHITVAWPTRRRRRSGILLTVVFLLLILSGYLLYYVGNESARSVISILHWTVGLAAPAAFFLHRLKRRNPIKYPAALVRDRIEPLRQQPIPRAPYKP